jgi:hypothetical protein
MLLSIIPLSILNLIAKKINIALFVPYTIKEYFQIL